MHREMQIYHFSQIELTEQCNNDNKKICKIPNLLKVA